MILICECGVWMTNISNTQAGIGVFGLGNGFGQGTMDSLMIPWGLIRFSSLFTRTEEERQQAN